MPELIGLTEEIGAAVRAKAQDDFEAHRPDAQDLLHRQPQAVRASRPRNCATWACSTWQPTPNCRPRTRCAMRPKTRAAAQV
ncbi:MAG: hypothetical protein M0C28_28800 [Candidatus Moduliflexus flocculans]|nr:hypothetical protein [Candidatus Moduliflexus flocculans]